MTTLLTFFAVPVVVWAVDRFFFYGELAAMVRDEARVILARRARASASRRG